MATVLRNGVAKHVEEAVDLNPHANGVLTQPAQTIAEVTIEGVSKLLFHRYDCEAVEIKGKAGKGTAAKKTDDLESYLYRDDDGRLAIPAENLHSSLAISAKSFQDPRSPRKSAMDLFKAGVLVMPDMLTLRDKNGDLIRKPDFIDRRRVTINKSAISRSRPGIESGWQVDAEIQILLPNLISAELLRSVLANAGTVVGLCDFRPRFGRFQVTKARVVDLD